MSRNGIHPVLAAALLAWARGAPGAELGTVDSLSVEECVAEARRHAPAVRAAGLDLAAARADSSAAAVNARPTLSLLAGATEAPNGFYDPTITNLGEYELKLSLDMTAADGGRHSRARRRGALDLSASGQRAAMETRDAGLEAARLAIEALRLQEEVAAQQQSIDWLDRLARLVRAGVTGGTRSASDSTRVALERDAAANALEAANLEVRATALELGALLGRDEGGSLAVRGPPADADREPSSADSIRLLALVERFPEVQIARALSARSQLDLLDARSARSPELTFSIDAGLEGADLTHAVPPDLLAERPGATFEDRLRRDLGASASMHLRLPLLDPPARPIARGREASLRAEEVRAGAEVAAQRRAMLSLFSRWRSASRRVGAAERSEERADANLLRVKSLYGAGGTTLLDVLDARHVYEEARVRLADARAEKRLLQLEAEDRR
jgi:outer membrane protein TolC